MKKYVINAIDEGKSVSYEIESDVPLATGDIIFLIPDGRFFLTTRIDEVTFSAMRVSGDEVDIYKYRSVES